MSTDDIRLRLSIRRHGVPEVKLVWPCTANQDLTIAKLLAQVSEVVPLEGGQWGLEDYAVELQDTGGGGFECLHFQQVGKVFKHDDQIIIRSLLTEDLKRRKLSGRHQISADGKHLVDGLAFGRPWLRSPRDRPAVTLPPRKRARITYDPEDEDEDEEEEEDEDPPQRHPLPRMLPPSPLQGQIEPSPRTSVVRFDGVPDDSSESEEDNDYEPEDDSESDIILDQSHIDESESEDEESADDIGDNELHEEIKILQEDNAIIGDDPDHQSPGNDEVEAGSESQPQDTIPGMVPFQAGSHALKAAFPLLKSDKVENQLAEAFLDVPEAYAELSKATDPVLTLREVLYTCTTYDDARQTENTDLGEEDGEEEEDDEDGNSLPPLKLNADEPAKTNGKPLIEEVVETEVAETGKPSEVDLASATAPAPALIQVVEEGDEADASDNEDTSDSDSSSEAVASDLDSELDSDESDGDFGGDSNDDDSSSSDSSSDEDDTSSKQAPTLVQVNGIGDHPPSESSVDADQGEGVKLGGANESAEVAPEQANRVTEDSSSESSSEEDSSEDSSSDDSSDDGSDDSSDDDSSDSSSAPEEASSRRPAAAATTAPQVESKTVAATPEEAPPALCPGQGRTRTQKRNARRRAMKQQKARNGASTSLADVEKALHERKQALMDAMEVEEANETAESNVLETQLEGKPLIEELPNDDTTAKENDQVATEASTATEKPTESTGETQKVSVQVSSDPKDDSDRPRTKFDAQAGRRLLFGALGLKNPKTKQDEEKIKNDLMKDVRPLQNHRIDGSAKATEKVVEEEDKDFDWKSKIVYRAVECCRDNIVLSKPPFPFVQRWDPQQQYSLMRKRKRNTQNVDQGKYDDDQSWHDTTADAAPGSSTKRMKKTTKRRGSKEPDEGHVELNYEDPPSRAFPGTSQFSDNDDLPALPADVTTLPLVNVEDVKPGMVITWKHWHLPKTSWEPQLIDLTGMVLSIDADQILRLILARRNRDTEEKVYNEETGERIYDKFDAPTDSDDDEGEEKMDDGYRDMPWKDMAQPRKVQDPPAEVTNMYVNTQTAQQQEQQAAAAVAEETPWPWPPLNDTLQVKANVEADLKALGASTKDSESIQPGQKTSSMDYSAPSLAPMTPSGQWKSANTQDPSWQPDTSSFVPPGAESSHIQDDTFFPTSDGLPMNDSADAVDAEDSANVGDSSYVPDITEPDVAGTDSLPQLKMSPSSPANKAGDETGSIRYPKLRVSPSADSLRSGRQPLAEDGMEVDQAGDSMVPGTEPEKKEKGPTPEPQADNHNDASSSPFPSLEEIWHSANTQSQQNPSQFSVFKGKQDDGAYDEAMKRLDEGEESDASLDPNKSIRNLFPNATQPVSADKPDKFSTPRRDPATPVKPKAKAGKSKSPFKIPPGSQVIDLDSSPASPRFAEHYADDSLDETYDDRSSSLPHGPGWVQKSRPRRDAKADGRKSMPPASSMSAFMVHGKGRRKTTRRF